MYAHFQPWRILLQKHGHGPLSGIQYVKVPHQSARTAPSLHPLKKHVGTHWPCLTPIKSIRVHLAHALCINFVVRGFIYSDPDANP